MADWRFQRGWTDAELDERLRGLAALAPNFDASAGAMTPEDGWNHVWSQAVIAREPPGAAVPGGPFERARALLERFEFSDPRIVVGHYERESGVRGRGLLLELKSLGLRFLCPVRVGEVRSADSARPTFGYCLDTLEGHLEAGREWFLLAKDPASGELRFRIEAFWRPGQFPTWWSRVGFVMLVRRYQRAWHRLAHVRLRRLLVEGAPGLMPGKLVHEGTELADIPVQFFASRGSGPRRIPIEQEGEEKRMHRLLFGTAWGALAGARSLLPLAFLSTVFSRGGPSGGGRWESAIGSPRTARVVRGLAVAELLADKTPWIPARVAPPALFGRALSGAVAAGSLAQRARQPVVGPAALGAAAAVAAAFASFKLRAAARLAIPSGAAGLIEDLVASATATALSRRLSRAPR